MRKLLEETWSFFALAMMLIGIGGLSFQLMKTDGVVSRLLGRVWDAELANPLIMTPVILGSLWLAWACLGGRLVVGKRNRAWDLVVFALMFTGIYFTYCWLSASIG